MYLSARTQVPLKKRMKKELASGVEIMLLNTQNIRQVTDSFYDLCKKKR